MILLLPAVVWSILGVGALAEKGFYSYTFLFPFPLRIHTVSVLNISIFYLVTFLVVRPHQPLRNFSVSSSLLFLSNAVYELVYGILYDWTSLQVTIPLILAGTGLLVFLNLRFRFLTNSRGRLLLFVLCFLGFVVIMLVLDRQGFFAEMRFFLSGLSGYDPHNLPWALSKTLSTWMFFPLLAPVSIRRRSECTRRASLSSGTIGSVETQTKG